MSNKYKILVVEDEENIKNLIGMLLESNGYQAITAESCESGRMMFSSHMPDLVILDLGLPDADGTVLLSEIRKNSGTPVIILSARAEEADKVNALDMGANDYITKPFGSAELMARVRSALRSHRYANIQRAEFRTGELVVNYDSRRVFIDGREIKLTQTEYNIVSFLSKHSGKVMTYHSIIKSIWGYSDYGSIKKLQVNMVNIRKKFGAKPGKNNYIENELGVGYRMLEEKD